MEAYSIEQLLYFEKEVLYQIVGQSVIENSNLGAIDESPEKLQSLGENWFKSNREKLANALCGTYVVKTYLESDRVSNRILIVAAVADLIAPFVTVVPIITVAVLIIREGLESLCDIKEN